VPDDNPVACCLSEAELRKREATLLAQFKSALTATEELPDGYAFRLPGEKRWLALVADLIRQGDAILMQPLLLHASSTARLRSGRRVVHLEFAAEELPNGLRWRDRV
jgi:hypothetical protein